MLTMELKQKKVQFLIAEESAKHTIYGEFNDYSDFMPILKKYDSDCKRMLEFRDLLVLITKK
jgi:hypothetical protein